MSGSSQQTTNSSQETSSKTSPWAPQQTEIQNAWGYANDAYKKSSQAQGPSGFVAGMTPDQLSTFQKMVQYGTGSDPNAQAGNSMTQAGASAATGALNDLGAFNPGNATDQNIADATKYANNPAMDGMVDAAMRDARRTASEATLPGITQNAALTGNTNSSRRALAEGMVERGLAEKTADVSANLRGQAYSQGLGLASDNNQFNQSAMLDAMKARLSGGTAAAVGGASAAGQSIDNQGKLFDIANQGGAGQQANTQLGYDDQMAKYGFNTSSPYDAVNQLWNIIGSNSWGSQTKGTATGTQQSTSTPSAWQVIGGLMGATGSLLNGFNSMGGGSLMSGTR